MYLNYLADGYDEVFAGKIDFQNSFVVTDYFVECGVMVKHINEMYDILFQE
jgi:hypothetical protein